MRGFRIICKLSKWDKNNKINNIIDSLLQVLDDEKPTIVRLCLSSLNNLLLYKIDLSEKVESKLKNMDLSKYKDSMYTAIKGQGAFKNSKKIKVNNYTLEDIKTMCHCDMWSKAKYNVCNIFKELRK